MNKILLEEILPLKELGKLGKVLLVRHQRNYLKKLLEKDLLERYQSFQNKPAFKNSSYIVSFVAVENNQARLYGVYKKVGIKEKEELPKYGNVFLEKVCNPQNKKTDFYLELEKLHEYEKYSGRLIINWAVPRGWYNTFGETKNKEVIKILPEDFVANFPGVMNIKVPAIQLRNIIKARQTEWYDALTRLQAVYLILDKSTGKEQHYIGTTYGEKGLWQRWESYVNGDFTGGNKRLKVLKQQNEDFYDNFQFSVLEVLTKGASKNDCLNAESNWKEKLGSKFWGLNDN